MSKYILYMKHKEKTQKFPVVLTIIYALIYWSIMALAATGQVNLGVLILFAGLVTITISPNSPLKKLPPFLWTFMTIVSFLAAIYLAGYDFLLSLLLLFFYLILNKISNPMQPRDEMQTLALCFFLCVSSTVITDSLIFALFLTGYLFLFTVGMLTVTIKAEQEETLRASSVYVPGFPQPIPPRLDTSFFGLNYLSKFTALILLMLLPVGGLLFLLIPRFSTQRFLSNLGSLYQQAPAMGYSETVDLGSMAGVKKDPKVMLRVQPFDQSGKVMRVPSIYMRGTSLDFYDGKRWFKSARATSMSAYMPPTRHVSFMSRPSMKVSRFIQRVFLEPDALPYIFSASYPYAFSFSQPYEMIIDNEANSVRLTRGMYEKISYIAYSLLEDEDARKNLSSQIQPPSDDLLNSRFYARLSRLYLQLPRRGLDERISNLANEITKQAKTPFEQVVRIENFLRTNYTYSLDFTEKGTEDPIVEFLFDRKTGHCEFFATAMAMLCRTIGLPARVVNGFYTDEWNNYGEYFIVRRQDAHSWVEVWFNETGWLSFDPTPPAGRIRETTGTWVPDAIQKIYDTIKFHWYQYVIDYNINDQMRIGHHLRGLTGGLGRVLDNATLRIRLFLQKGKSIPKIGHIMTWLMPTGIILLLLSALGYIFKRLRQDKKRVVQESSSRRYKGAEITWVYEKILAHLRERGFERHPSQTPLEFATVAIRNGSAPQDFLPLTRRYYTLRFRNDPCLPADEKMFNDFMRSLGAPTIPRNKIHV